MTRSNAIRENFAKMGVRVQIDLNHWRRPIELDVRRDMQGD